MIANQEGKEVGRGAVYARLPQQHLGLRRIKSDALGAGVAQILHFSHRWQRGASRGQARQQLLRQSLRLRARDGAHHADAGVARRKTAGVQAAHVGHFDLRQALRRADRAIGVRAKHGLGKGFVGKHIGPRVGFAQRGYALGALALPHGRGQAGLGDLSRQECDGGLQQFGPRQTAQADAHAVLVYAHAHLRGEVGPAVG